MENDEIKSLKRQRSFLIGIAAVLALVTLVSMVYAFVQQGIAKENRLQADEYAIIAQKNAEEANRQVVAANKALEEANRQKEIATLHAARAEEANKKRNK